MTNDLTKMGNEELLDKFEEAARDKDYSHQRTVDDFWTLHAELLRRLDERSLCPKCHAENEQARECIEWRRQDKD